MKTKLYVLFLCIGMYITMFPMTVFAEDVTGTVRISGSGLVGEELTATYSGGNVTNPSYKWLVRSESQGTATTFTPTEDMVGCTVYCQVSDGDGVLGGIVQGSITVHSAETHTMTFVIPSEATIELTGYGDYTNGQSTSVSKGDYCTFTVLNIPKEYMIEASTDDGASILYSEINPRQFGIRMPDHDITVTVIKKETTNILGEVTITGSGNIAEPLTASYANGNITDPVFKWLVAATNVGTGPTFTPTADMVGKTAYVQVSSASNQKDGIVQASISITNDGSHTTHIYDKSVATYKYLKTAADCNNAAVYYKSCACGEIGTETFTSDAPLGHYYNSENICTRCGQKKPIEVVHDTPATSATSASSSESESSDSKVAVADEKKATVAKVDISTPVLEAKATTKQNTNQTVSNNDTDENNNEELTNDNTIEDNSPSTISASKVKDSEVSAAQNGDTKVISKEKKKNTAALPIAAASMVGIGGIGAGVFFKFGGIKKFK